MQNTSVIKILIVDDHPVVRMGLESLIDRQPDLEVCGQASGLSQALSMVDTVDPDVAVVDISLQDGDGIDLIRRIRARNPRIQMLVWSMYPETMYAERALRAGAMGYLNKQEAATRIVEAIRSIHGGKIYLSELMASQLLRRTFDRVTPVAPTGIDSLSDRELEVLRMIGQGQSTAEVAGQLHLSVHTIETYRQRIKGKLALKNPAELARVAVQWVLEHG